MNRREALAALVAMPNVARIAAVPAASSDVIVVECEGYLSNDAVKNIRDGMKRVWPDREIVVLDRGLRIKVAPR